MRAPINLLGGAYGVCACETREGVEFEEQEEKE